MSSPVLHTPPPATPPAQAQAQAQAPTDESPEELAARYGLS
ncbi:ABC transporter permease, partial [Streptomyces spongiae]|nr:ABC transporter permease [Streptomyces spongiae]